VASARAWVAEMVQAEAEDLVLGAGKEAGSAVAKGLAEGLARAEVEAEVGVAAGLDRPLLRNCV